MNGESTSEEASNDAQTEELDLRTALHNDLKRQFSEKLESKPSISSTQRDALAKLLSAEAPTSVEILRALSHEEVEQGGEADD